MCSFACPFLTKSIKITEKKQKYMQNAKSCIKILCKNEYNIDRERLYTFLRKC